jgi:hypothetical protein
MNANALDKPVWLMRDKATMATIQGLRQRGITTAADIARALNDQGVLSPKGNKWHAALVQRIITHGTVPSSPSLSETVQSPAISCVTGEVLSKNSGTGYMPDKMPEKSAAQGYRLSCQATIKKDIDVYSMTLTTWGGGQSQVLVEKTLESYHEAEMVARAFASHHGFPWHKVKVVSR